jgi:hypothetical protein
MLSGMQHGVWCMVYGAWHSMHMHSMHMHSVSSFTCSQVPAAGVILWRNTLYSYTMHIHCTHTLCTYTMHIHYAHTLSTYTVYIHCTHTLSGTGSRGLSMAQYTVLIHCVHTLCTYTVYIHYQVQAAGVFQWRGHSVRKRRIR